MAFFDVPHNSEGGVMYVDLNEDIDQGSRLSQVVS